MWLLVTSKRRACSRCIRRASKGSFCSEVHSAASAGTYTGDSFTGYDFSNAGVDSTRNERLVVTVDGGAEQLVEVTENCDSLVSTAAALAIGGATVAVTAAATLLITSDSVGSSSSVLVGNGSGANAKALFGAAGVAEAGN
eukprot:SAG31_NODE_5212_length_2673_cov_2.442890_1_plen_141_part_00